MMRYRPYFLVRLRILESPDSDCSENWENSSIIRKWVVSLASEGRSALERAACSAAVVSRQPSRLVASGSNPPRLTSRDLFSSMMVLKLSRFLDWPRPYLSKDIWVSCLALLRTEPA